MKCPYGAHISNISTKSIRVANADEWVYFIEPDWLKYAYLIRNYLNNVGIYQPTFMLNAAYKGNVKKRFYKFRDQICPNCEDVRGFPSIILMNKKRKVLYKKTGAINTDTLQKIINIKK